MVVGFSLNYSISAYHYGNFEFYTCSWQGASLDTTLW